MTGSKPTVTVVLVEGEGGTRQFAAAGVTLDAGHLFVRSWASATRISGEASQDSES